MRKFVVPATAAISAAAAWGITQAVGLTIPAATAGDWLSFAGSMAGVILAVAGAIYVEDFKAMREATRTKNNLIKANHLVLGALQYGVNDGAKLPDHPLEALQWRQMTVVRCINSFENALNNTKIDDAGIWQVLQTGVELCNGLRAVIESQKDAINANPAAAYQDHETTGKFHEALTAAFAVRLNYFLHIREQLELWKG